MKKTNDILISIILIGIAGGVFYFTKDLQTITENSIGSAFWPRALAIILLILALILLAQAIFQKVDSIKKTGYFQSHGFKKVLKICGIMIIFSTILKFTGFIFAIIFLLPSTMYVLGEKRIKWLSGTTISVVLLVYIVFELILGIQLPEGIFI